MIKIMKRITASAIWDINGSKVTLTYKKEYPAEITHNHIESYLNCLKDKTYLTDNSELCRAFLFFGGIAFVAIGMTDKDSFMACYTNYSKEFAKEWAMGEKQLKSKYIGYEYVFEKMLENMDYTIKYNFKYILDGQKESNLFCLINEESFAEYWTKEMLPLMKLAHTLQNIDKRIGAVRLSKYLMQIPKDTKNYLKSISEKYTQNREMISLRKITNFIFGDGSRTSFVGGDEHFFKLLEKTVADELEIQRVKFIVENHRELNVNNDVWVLYQMQGVALKFMTVDFTKVERLSFRQELKYFLKNRFSHSIRVNDRTLFCLFDVSNMLCEINPKLHYFSDLEITDVKALQLRLEQEMTQSAIMSVFSALKVLFDYLCSDENISPYPKPFDNVMNSIKFVNAKKYRNGTKYIPDEVLNGILKHLDELAEIDSIVFQIFAETGMREKEVSFLEANCLKKARYKDYYILSFVPHKIINARRKRGLMDNQEIYISNTLAKLIKKQIKRSEEIRKQHNLPYIFLHQNAGYKPAMLNVEYFSTKINALIKRHNLCDKDENLWHFTSHQCRKTVIVNMVENGATVHEMAHKLGHLSHSTVMEYYAEVRNIKLAQMNTEFYKKQFDVLISKEQLTSFSEEERRLLYVDFRLGNRRVELGFCSKKLCDGPCKNINRAIHCVNCPNLCTGIKYLEYWGKLKNSQQEIVDALILGYESQNIVDYEAFAEYKSESNLLLSYENIIIKIKESEVRI